MLPRHQHRQPVGVSIFEVRMSKKSSQVPCGNCGTMFTPNHPNRSKTHTCSRRCRGALKSKLQPKVKVRCDNCGVEFERHSSKIREGQDIFFCSRKCTISSKKVYLKVSKILKGRPQPEGNLEMQRKTKITNGRWKPIGAIYSRKRKGRTDVFIKVRENSGHKNWMLYHRYLVEQLLGRPLESYEEVHHLDGDETNNDINNLVLISKKDHSLITKLLKTIDHDFARTIVKTLVSRHPGLLDD